MAPHTFYAIRTAALDTLRTVLNDRYGTGLCEVIDSPAFESRFLKVQRASSLDDVVIAVACIQDDDHGFVYVVEAFTTISWDRWGSAFACHRCPTAGAAADAVTAIVSVIPPH
jgi:hypothetical protein